MAKKQQLSVRAYAFSLKKFHTRGYEQTIELNTPINTVLSDGNEKTYASILELFKEFIAVSNVTCDKEERQQLFRCSFNPEHEGETENFRYMVFSVYAGYYGFASEVINRESKRVVYQKTKDEADVKEFYVMIVVPKDTENDNAVRGLLFFQEIGLYGVKTITTDTMQEFFSQNARLTLKTQNLAPDFYLNKLFEQGIIKKVKLARNIVQADSAEQLYGSSIGREERAFVPLAITNSLKRSLRHVAEDEYSFFTYDNLNYNEVKMEVTIGDRTRTIDLHGLDTLSIEEALPQDLLLADGTVAIDHFIEHMLGVADEYLNHLPTSF